MPLGVRTRWGGRLKCKTNREERGKESVERYAFYNCVGSSYDPRRKRGKLICQSVGLGVTLESHRLPRLSVSRYVITPSNSLSGIDIICPTDRQVTRSHNDASEGKAVSSEV